jgi:hypothetical protein
MAIQLKALQLLLLLLMGARGMMKVAAAVMLLRMRS